MRLSQLHCNFVKIRIRIQQLFSESFITAVDDDKLREGAALLRA